MIRRYAPLSLSKLGYFRFCISLATSLILFYAVSPAQSKDSLICSHLSSIAVDKHLDTLPIREIITAVGKQFIGTPYEAHTLDHRSGERLITNLHSFDCVTFIENVLALSRSIKSHHPTFEAYRNELQFIRYRSGKLNDYTSRLHYFTEWMKDNEKKLVLKDVTAEIGGIPFHPVINFMTTHRSAYPQLASDSVYNRMKEIETSLNGLPLSFIPKNNVHAIQSKIHSGDIIAITTNIHGLDISHTGIAVRTKDGSLHYLHAPNVGEHVTITTETLEQYLQRHSVQTGIMVLRAKEPAPPR